MTSVEAGEALEPLLERRAKKHGSIQPFNEFEAQFRVFHSAGSVTSLRYWVLFLACCYIWFWFESHSSMEQNMSLITPEHAANGRWGLIVLLGGSTLMFALIPCTFRRAVPGLTIKVEHIALLSTIIFGIIVVVHFFIFFPIEIDIVENSVRRSRPTPVPAPPFTVHAEDPPTDWEGDEYSARALLRQQINAHYSWLFALNVTVVAFMLRPPLKWCVAHLGILLAAQIAITIRTCAAGGEGITYPVVNSLFMLAVVNVARLYEQQSR
jgi:hypothetical protein